MIISIYLPTLKSTKKANLEIYEKELKFEFPGKFKLERNLPYRVNANKGSARFQKDEEILEIRIPVLPEPVSEPPKLITEEAVEEKENIEPPETITPLIEPPEAK